MPKRHCIAAAVALVLSVAGRQVAAAPTPCPAATSGPNELDVTVADSGSDLDAGWTGELHDLALAGGSTLRLCLSGCDGDKQPVCKLTGPTGLDSLNGPTFGPPQPVLAGGVALCVVNRFVGDVVGAGSLVTGQANVNLELRADVYVGSPADVCPRCVAGACDWGANVGGACTVDATVVSNGGQDVYPVSRDCLPDPAQLGSTLALSVPLTTGAAVLAGPQPCQASADDACASGVCDAACTGPACVAIVNGQCVDAKGGIGQVCCSDDTTRPCFPSGPQAAGAIVRKGVAAPPAPKWPDPVYPKTAPATLVAVFCAPATGSSLLDPAVGLPGPAALVMPGTLAWVSAVPCPADCDDGNPCTTDFCDVAKGCVHVPAAKGTVCRAAQGPCDLADRCDGQTPECPVDQLADAQTPCRPAAGECDRAEVCTGLSPACPDDALLPAGSPCADDGDLCTTDACDGASAVCQHPAGNHGAVCRPAAGPCDVAERCDGESGGCPFDALASPDVECRAAAGSCDVAEHCSGEDADCPADRVAEAGVECAPEAPCGVAGVCTGEGAGCPARSFKAATEICRPAAGPCDVAERCPGTSADCPADAFVPDGTVCGDGNACNGDETCSDGACAAATAARAPVLPACRDAVPFAAITNFDGDTISLVDLETGAVSATLPVGDGPWGVAVHPRGTRIYVTNQHADTLSIVDPSGAEAMRTVAVGRFPLGVAVSPDGARVYVSNFDDGTVAVVDAGTGTFLTSVAVGRGPSGLAVDPAGARVYVANYRSDSVSVIDTASNAVVASVRVGHQPLGVVVQPGGARVYVNDRGAGTVSVIGAASDSVVDTIPVGRKPYGIAIDRTGTTLYVVDATDSDVRAIDPATGALRGIVAVGPNPFGIALDPTGERLVVANGAGGSLSIVDAASLSVTRTVPVGTTPVALGQFTGVLRVACPAPAPDCDDGDPFTVDACAPADGCHHTPVGGMDAVLAGLGLLADAIHTAPLDALASPDAAGRLVQQVGDVRDLLASGGPRALLTPARFSGPARARLQQASRRLGAFVNGIARDVRRGRIRRDVGERLLDVGRATRARMRRLRVVGT